MAVLAVVIVVMVAGGGDGVGTLCVWSACTARMCAVRAWSCGDARVDASNSIRR